MSIEHAPERNGQDRLVREPERRELTGVSEATWRRYEKAGTAPRRRQIGPNAVGWRLSEITRWQQSRPQVALETEGA